MFIKVPTALVTLNLFERHFDKWKAHSTSKKN